MRFILILVSILSLLSTSAYANQDYGKMAKGEEFKLAVSCTAHYDLMKRGIQSDDTLKPIINEFSEYSRLAAMALSLLENPNAGVKIYKQSYRTHEMALMSIQHEVRVGITKKCAQYIPRAKAIAGVFCKNPNFSDLGSCSYL